MVDIKKSIENYGLSVLDTEVSPFESVDMLHRRTMLHSLLPQMTYQEKNKLYMYDLQLILNAHEMSEHIKEIYDFSLSIEPIEQWWWHLEKISTGELVINVKTEVEIL